MSPPYASRPIRLDPRSGVPVYRQIIDQVLAAVASGSLQPGDQLPTVRQLAVDLSINPNTVARAYRELELRGALASQQGLGTFISPQPVLPDEAERSARLNRLVADLLARAGAEGFSAADILSTLQDHLSQPPQ